MVFSFFRLLIVVSLFSIPQNQGVFMLTLPKDENLLLPYLVAALVLKTLDVIHILAVQCTVDAYLIDWERPQNPSNTTAALSRNVKAGDRGK